MYPVLKNIKHQDIQPARDMMANLPTHTSSFTWNLGHTGYNLPENRGHVGYNLPTHISSFADNLEHTGYNLPNN